MDMEESWLKENLPLRHDNEVRKSLKLPVSTPREPIKTQSMSTLTPRQPLLDIKQVGRPVETVMSNLHVPVKSVTILGTPKPSFSQRKMKPSSLLKHPDKENMMTQSGYRNSDIGSTTHRMDEIFEENVEEFVTKVLDQCVQDLKEQDKINESITIMDGGCLEKMQNGDPVMKNTESNMNLNADTSTKESALQTDQNIDTKGDCAHMVERHELVSQFGDMSVNEDSLLGNSYYDDCSESFTESTKSEEELLASYVQTPNIGNITGKDKTDEIHELCIEECKSGFNKIETPHPTFLEKVAVMQRVRNATSSLASWVFPRETMEHHIQQLSADEKVKLVHDAACSPMPQRRHTTSVSDRSDKRHDCSTSADDNQNLRDLCNSDQVDLCSNGNSFQEHLQMNSLKCDLDGCAESAISENVLSCPSLEKGTKEGIKDSQIDVELGLSTDIYQSYEGDVSSHDFLVNEPSKDTEVSTQTEYAAFSTVACSPMNIPVCDFSVQNEIQTQSILCSPIRFENQAVSIQNEAEMRSMICSPIRFHGHDVSVQNSAEMQSVMCSPIQIQGQDVSIQNQIDTHSIMCSPIPVQTEDVSVQYQIDTHSNMCSPMVPCPSEDKSVLVSGPEVTDAGIMTDERASSDIGIHVQPDVQTVCTGMDENPMVTTCTSMTPLKFDKKQGRKLTAEDVRKQHPRVLANELETLRLQNSRLEGQVQSLEKDRKKLVAQEELQTKLEETKKALQEVETRHSEDSQKWSTQKVALETEMSVLKLEQEKEIDTVRAEYESNDYREHFLASQKLVQELQAELDEYSKVVDEIEKAQNIQVELENAVSNGFGKIKQKAEWIKEQHKDIQTTRDQLHMQLKEYQTDLQALEQDKVAIEKERNQMSDIVHSCKENVLEMDTQLQKANAELGATKETVLIMREETDVIMKEKEKTKSYNEDLVKQNETLQMEVDKLSEEIKGLNSTIQQQEEQLDSLNTSLKEATEKLQNETASYKSEREKKALMVTNLGRTLENRESEIDLMEKDLFECREIIYTQMEAGKAHEKREKEMTAELEALKKECDRLKDCCANLRAKEQNASATLKSTQEELAGVQEYASVVMKQQGTEIADCSSAIGELVSHMTSILTNLSRRAGILDKTEESDTDANRSGISSETTNSNNKMGQTSLVTQILDAAKSLGDGNQNDTSDTEKSDVLADCDSLGKNVEQVAPSHVDALSSEQEVVDSPGALSRKKLGFSGNSAFAPVRSLKLVQTQQAESEGTCSTEEPTINPHSNTYKHNVLSNCFSKKVESRFEGVCLVEQEEGLTSQMTRVTELFTEITRVSHLIEKALRSSLNDVTFENDDLNSRASQCEYSEGRLQAQLQVSQTELEKSKNVVEQLNAKLEEMGEKFESMLDQELDTKRLQEEISRFRGKYQAIEAEKELLNEQITELLQKMETVSGAGSQGMSGVDVNSQREILSLRKKVDKYRTMLNEKDTLVEQISAKATSRINKLEANWKKADEEVCRFDELVDTVRAVLSGNKTAMEDAQLVKLIELIDGSEKLSSFENERKKTELKPVKTDKW